MHLASVSAQYAAQAPANFYEHFPFFMIILPMVTSIFMPLLRKGSIAKYLTMVVQLVIAVLSLGLIVSLWAQPESAQSFTYAMGHFGAPIGNELRGGLLEAMMSFSFAAVMFFSLLGGVSDTDRDIQGRKQYLFYLMIGLLTTSLMALVYTNDLFTAYVFIEINTVAACAIVVAKENGETVKATIKYCLMSVLGSGLFLLSTSILYGLTGHLLMQPAHVAIQELVQNQQYHLPLVVTLGLFAVSIAVKSALFPFHTWLPDAHGSATTTSSAVLSGLVLKGYIVLFMKMVFRIYGFDTVEKLGILPALMALGIIAMIYGSIVAFRQTDIKRMIAYSSVAQIGYIFLGIGMGNIDGFTAASYHIIAHAFTKSMLFIAAGSLINTAGSKNIKDMVGAGRKNKVAGIAFVVGALSMMGVPLFAGFPSKFYLANSALGSDYGVWFAIAALVLSTFLNALYYAPVLVRLYAGDGKTDAASNQLAGTKPSAAVTLCCLIVANFALGIFFNPLLNAISAGFQVLG